MYIKYSTWNILTILYFWFPHMSELTLAGTGSDHGFTWTPDPILFYMFPLLLQIHSKIRLHVNKSDLSPFLHEKLIPWPSGISLGGN